MKGIEIEVQISLAQVQLPTNHGHSCGAAPFATFITTHGWHLGKAPANRINNVCDQPSIAQRYLTTPQIPWNSHHIGHCCSTFT